MQAISKAVGEGQPNVTEDVTLIQAALVKIAKPAVPGKPAGPYLASYDGVFTKSTTNSILAFQADRKLAGPNVAAGRVAPGDGTFKALAAALPQDMADLRALPGARTAHLAAKQANLVNRLTEVAGKTFTTDFGVKVNATVRKMFADTGIALAIDPDGDHRTFQKQYNLRTSGRGVTKAGPGESNHNFGGAVDLGFKSLRWLKPDGTVVQEQLWWLGDMPQRNQQPFWDTLRNTGIACGAFRGPLGDRPHLQNWNDDGVSMVRRLAALLTRVGDMKWSVAHGVYSCDLGLGGALVPVGTSVQIWNMQATVDEATIDLLRSARLKRDEGRHPAAAAAPQQPGARPQVPAASAPPGSARPNAAPAAPTKVNEVAAMQQTLRHEFESAEAHWRDWTAQ